MSNIGSFLDSARESFAAPDDRIGRYVVLGTLGNGGMGVVYRAWDPSLQREVALKVLEAHTSEERARFLREATLAASIQHPNLVPIFEIGEAKGRSYIAMALIDGASLAGKVLDPRRAAEVAAQAARALHAAHANNILHRDIKPGNLLVDKTGRIFLADFGIARRIGEPSIATTGVVVGTPAFMSPEQSRGDTLDARTDVYSLGATLYALVTGRPPEEFDESPFPKEIPREIRAIARKAMHPAPIMRFQTAAEMADDLERFLRGEPILTRGESAVGRLRKRLARNPSAWALAMLLVVAVLAAAAFARSQRREMSRLESFWNATQLPRKYNETRAQFAPILAHADDRYYAHRPADRAEADRLIGRLDAELDRLEDHWKRTSLPEAYRGWLLANLGFEAEGERRLEEVAGSDRLDRGDPYGAVFLARWKARKLCRTEPDSEEWKLECRAIREIVTRLLEWNGWSDSPENRSYLGFLQGLDHLTKGHRKKAWLAFAFMIPDPLFGRDALELALRTKPKEPPKPAGLGGPSF